MAQPRIFVSSTYYDLKYVRSSLELFVESLGYEAVLSEKGDVAYAPDLPLDESCYREVQSCDVYVLIVGGRYGSEATSSRESRRVDPSLRIESITKLEYRAAVAKDLPIYVLVERSVFGEYQTFQRNRDVAVNYAHVDDVNVFRFLDDILAQPRNNPLHTFEKYAEIEEWLRSQWAGLFRELLYRMSQQKQIASLAAQVAELSEANKTLRTYLEEVVGKVSPASAPSIIAAEQKRLDDAGVDRRLEQNDFVEYLIDSEFLLKDVRTALEEATSLDELRDLLDAARKADPAYVRPRALVPPIGDLVLADINDSRETLRRPPLKPESNAA